MLGCLTFLLARRFPLSHLLSGCMPYSNGSWSGPALKCSAPAPHCTTSLLLFSHWNSQEIMATLVVREAHASVQHHPCRTLYLGMKDSERNREGGVLWKDVGSSLKSGSVEVPVDFILTGVDCTTKVASCDQHRVNLCGKTSGLRKVWVRWMPAE